jgi:hypothetical protein
MPTSVHNEEMLLETLLRQLPHWIQPVLAISVVTSLLPGSVLFDLISAHVPRLKFLPAWLMWTNVLLLSGCFWYLAPWWLMILRLLMNGAVQATWLLGFACERAMSALPRNSWTTTSVFGPGSNLIIARFELELHFSAVSAMSCLMKASYAVMMSAMTMATVLLWSCLTQPAMMMTAIAFMAVCAAVVLSHAQDDT